MKYDELKKVLDLHKKWLNGDADGRRADLQNADLQDVDLRGADLRGADAQNASFAGANLQNVDLREADLRGADFFYANLQNVELRGADLRDAKLQGAKNIPDLPWMSIVPECGSFIGWKRVGAHIIKLKILEDAKRSNATGRICRCSAAEVLEIQNIDGTESGIDRVYNNNYCGANYVVGKIVTPDRFDDDRWDECSNGIHFFITRQEAVDYRKHSLHAYLLNK